MSTDAPESPAEVIADTPLATASPSVVARALVVELRRLETERLRRADGEGATGEPIISPAELQDLVGGEMTRLEMARFQRLVVIELLGRGMSIRTIAQRLRLSGERLGRLLKGLVCDGSGRETVEHMRAAVNAGFDWNIAQATAMFLKTHKQHWLAQRSTDLVNKAKLNGLAKPQQLEMVSRREVAVELRVIESREQWVAIQRAQEQPEREPDLLEAPSCEEASDATAGAQQPDAE